MDDHDEDEEVIAEKLSSLWRKLKDLRRYRGVIELLTSEAVVKCIGPFILPNSINLKQTSTASTCKCAFFE